MKTHSFDSVRDLIKEMDCDEALFLSPDCYDKAIIGISHDDRIIYSYDKLVEVVMENAGSTFIDARAWVDYNILDSLPSMGEHSPIVLFELDI